MVHAMCVHVFFVCVHHLCPSHSDNERSKDLPSNCVAYNTSFPVCDCDFFPTPKMRTDVFPRPSTYTYIYMYVVLCFCYWNSAFSEVVVAIVVMMMMMVAWRCFVRLFRPFGSHGSARVRARACEYIHTCIRMSTHAHVEMPFDIFHCMHALLHGRIWMRSVCCLIILFKHEPYMQTHTLTYTRQDKINATSNYAGNSDDRIDVYIYKRVDNSPAQTYRIIPVVVLY